MLENLDLDDLGALAETLPGPHVWAWCADDTFYCQACYIGFQFGADPVPPGPCTPNPDLPQGRVVLDGLDFDEFTRRYGRAEAERCLAEHELVLSPGDMSKEARDDLFATVKLL